MAIRAKSVVILTACAFGGLAYAQSSDMPKRAASSSVERSQIAPEIQTKLLGVKRIYIDSFGDDVASKKIQAMLMSSLSESKLFIVTENKDKADAILKGSAAEKSHQEMHALNDKAAASSVHGGSTGSVSGAFVNGSGTVNGSSTSHIAGSGVAVDDSVASTETIDEASVSVRLVSTDGDVIWTTTQESKGAKYKSSSADAASKVVKQLTHDLEKVQAAKANLETK